jgi:tagatose-1,6-bisphosphate aldolase
MGLTFVSQARRRTPLASLLLLSANWCLVGFVAHLLLRRAAGLIVATDGLRA